MSQQLYICTRHKPLFSIRYLESGYGVISLVGNDLVIQFTRKNNTKLKYNNQTFTFDYPIGDIPLPGTLVPGRGFLTCLFDFIPKTNFSKTLSKVLL